MNILCKGLVVHFVYYAAILQHLGLLPHPSPGGFTLLLSPGACLMYDSNRQQQTSGQKVLATQRRMKSMLKRQTYDLDSVHLVHSQQSTGK